MPNWKWMVNRCTIAAAILACTALEARSSDFESNPPGRSDRLDYFIFGGVINEGVFPGWSNVPFAAPLQDNYLVGVAVNYEFLEAGYGFQFGGEVGVAGRFGDGDSGEIWSGLSIRQDGIAVGPISIGLAIVIGLSAVTGPIGIEKTRELKNDGDATLLYYLGPEVSLRLNRHPDTEFVFRAHHRSGADNVSFISTLGNMGEGSNAYVFGVRFSY